MDYSIYRKGAWASVGIRPRSNRLTVRLAESGKDALEDLNREHLDGELDHDVMRLRCFAVYAMTSHFRRGSLRGCGAEVHSGYRYNSDTKKC